jgi:hypothetical protein
MERMGDGENRWQMCITRCSAGLLPKAKSKPASGMPRRRRSGLRFESLDQAQAYLDRWEAHWADTRIHGTTKRHIAAMLAEEQPALGPLPLEPFRYYRFGVRTVHLDGCMEAEAPYYGSPPGWIGRRVDVQWNDLFVRLLDPKTGQFCASTCVRRAAGTRLPMPMPGRVRYPLPSGPRCRIVAVMSTSIDCDTSRSSAIQTLQMPHIGVVTTAVHDARAPLGRLVALQLRNIPTVCVGV